MQTGVPRLTIVTAVLNRASMIREAIESVLEQDLAESQFEHVVIDGGSTDGTLDVLAEYPHLRVVSERDESVYDAMNKGIRAARGDFIGLLNSDDRYLPGSLPAALDAMTEATDMVVGGAVVAGGASGSGRVAAYPAPREGLDIGQLTHGVPTINSRFIRRSAFEDLGGFDTTFRLAADREWLLRAWLSGMPATVIKQPPFLYEYRQHEGSLTIGPGLDRSLLADEDLEICRRLLEQQPSREARRAIRRWRARMVAVSVRSHLRSRSFKAAATEAVVQAAEDPLWLARAVRHRLEAQKES